MSQGRPSLTLLVDAAALHRHGAEILAKCAAAGIDRVQFRDRGLESEAALKSADALFGALRSAAPAVECLVNRRIDWALCSEAQGVHLGFDALPIREARALLGPKRRIGVSVHSVAEAASATRDGADYVHLAPIFDPLSKPAERPALGPSAVGAASEAGAQVIALGGLAPHNAGACVAAGAAGVAVIGAILNQDDPIAATARLRAALDGAA